MSEDLEHPEGGEPGDADPAGNPGSDRARGRGGRRGRGFDDGGSGGRRSGDARAKESYRDDAILLALCDHDRLTVHDEAGRRGVEREIVRARVERQRFAIEVFSDRDAVDRRLGVEHVAPFGVARAKDDGGLSLLELGERLETIVSHDLRTRIARATEETFACLCEMLLLAELLRRLGRGRTLRLLVSCADGGGSDRERENRRDRGEGLERAALHGLGPQQRMP